jgi:hypothetical protein
MSTGASQERLPVTQEAAGSNPVAPANSLLSTLLSSSSGCREKGFRRAEGIVGSFPIVD